MQTASEHRLQLASQSKQAAQAEEFARLKASLETEVAAKKGEVEALRRSLEGEEGRVMEANLKSSKQAARIEELQREVHDLQKGAQELHATIDTLRT